jgi:hypothetical protein
MSTTEGDDLIGRGTRKTPNTVISMHDRRFVSTWTLYLRVRVRHTAQSADARDVTQLQIRYVTYVIS